MLKGTLALTLVFVITVKCADLEGQLNDEGNTDSENTCSEVCGEKSNVECKDNQTDALNTTCVCSEENLIFVDKEIGCKRNVCSEVCGDKPFVICEGDQTDEKKTRCTCSNENFIYFNKDRGCIKLPCSSNPCQNGGMCYMFGWEHMDCECTDEFMGEFCEIENLCVKKCGATRAVKCEGNITSEETFNCTCKTKAAEFIEDKKVCRIPCHSNADCKNSALCEYHGDKKYCSCKNGTSGVICQIVDNCRQGSYFCGDRERSGAECVYDDLTEKAVCKCYEASKKFDEYKDICRNTCDNYNNTCLNGGICTKRGDYEFCKCTNVTRGDRCETMVGCGNLDCKFDSTVCGYDPMSFKKFCKCKNHNKYFDAVEKDCISFDGCILKEINKECYKENEVCVNGDCQCKKNYKYSKNNESCEEDICATCLEGFECDESDTNEPCKCINGYFDGKRCVKYGNCTVGFSKCQQKCDVETGECQCGEGFKLSDDKVKCELTNDDLSCSDLDCHPGSCMKKDNKDTCICPEATHMSQNTSCIDLCTFHEGKPPKGMDCPDKCEKHGDDGIRCICKDPYEQAEDGIHCKRREMCKEELVIDECNKQSAFCVESNNKLGYECICDKTSTKHYGVCKKKCDLEKAKCIKMNAICELDEDYNATCVCPPLLTKNNEYGLCNKIADASYTGELFLLKSRYVVVEDKSNRWYKRSTEFIDYAKLKTDFIESAKYVYGNDFNNVNLVCKDERELLRCKIEMQFERNFDVNKLLYPSYCYIIDEEFCLIKNLVVKRGKYSWTFWPTDPCVVQDIFCDESTECNSDTHKYTFSCTCKSGLRSTRFFNPVSNPGNVLELCADVDECAEQTHDCPVNTTCKNTYRSYKCLCNDGFRTQFPNQDPKDGCKAVCDPNPCMNDGECSQKINNEYICRCPPTFTGIRCNEKVTTRVVEIDVKRAVIVSSIIGALLIIIFIARACYIKMKKNKERHHDEQAEHRQLSVSAAVVSQHKQRTENEYAEVEPDTRNLYDVLQGESVEYNRENSECTIIPRVQTSL